MNVTYQSKGYSADAVRMRYVKKGIDGYRFCEVGDDRRFDLRQGTVDQGEIPDGIRELADCRAGHCFSYVEWPM
jgi:hypothetical protein